MWACWWLALPILCIIQIVSSISVPMTSRKRTRGDMDPEEPHSHYRRGVRQRLADAVASHRPPVSALASLCLGEWSWGLMPASKIQKINAACKADNDNRGVASHDEVCKLASLGSHGQMPNNCN